LPANTRNMPAAATTAIPNLEWLSRPVMNECT
jgi:hypothetical protein